MLTRNGPLMGRERMVEPLYEEIVRKNVKQSSTRWRKMLTLGLENVPT